MQVKRRSKSRRITLKTIIVFLGILIIAYLPLSSFLFSLKSESFNNYFASRFFISESIHYKSFPWWNPYINFGIPQYGDYNSGFWNPITWIVASLFSYNAYTFTIELLFYLFLAGIGMFQLCRSYKFTKTASYITGITYLCSGYFVSHLQHFNWISAAAFLPWCLWGYNQLINNFNLKNNILCALIFYLFISSAHPGIIIGSIYFFTFYVIYFFFQKKEDNQAEFSAKSFIRKNLLMLGVLLIFCIGIIAGYSDVFPHITSGKKAIDASFINNPFSLQSTISILLPMATVKNDAFFGTDISMRNMYFGLTLLLFLIPAFFDKKSTLQKFFLYTGLFFFVLSLGGIFKYFSFTFLPLIGYVKMAGEFSVFSIICFILFGAISLNNFIVNRETFSLNQHKTYFFIQVIFTLAIIIGVIGIIITHNSLFLNISNVLSKPGLDSKLKSLNNEISFYDILCLQSIIQLVILGAVRNALIQKKYILLIKLCIIDLAIATLFNIPFTGVGTTSLSDVQYVLRKEPEGISTPFLLPIKFIHPNVTDANMNALGNWTFYNKQIGVNTIANYPIQLNSTNNVFKNGTSIFTDKPYVFCTNDSDVHNLTINYFKGNFIDLTINSGHKDSLIYQQNNYAHWRCVVNGQNLKPFTYAGVFNAITLEPGKNYVKFVFIPQSVNTAMTISLYSFIICLIYILIVMFKRPSR